MVLINYSNQYCIFLAAGSLHFNCLPNGLALRNRSILNQCITYARTNLICASISNSWSHNSSCQVSSTDDVSSSRSPSLFRDLVRYNPDQEEKERNWPGKRWRNVSASCMRQLGVFFPLLQAIFNLGFNVSLYIYTSWFVLFQTTRVQTLKRPIPTEWTGRQVIIVVVMYTWWSVGVYWLNNR